MSSVKYRPAWAAAASLLVLLFSYYSFLFLSVQLWPQQATPNYYLLGGGGSKGAAAGHFGTMHLVAVVVPPPFPKPPGPGGCSFGQGFAGKLGDRRMEGWER